jgi:hypothetical protein
MMLEKLHNEELHSLPNIIRMIKPRRMRLAGNVARMRAKRSVYRMLVGKPEGKKPLGKAKHRWVEHTEIPPLPRMSSWHSA